jgi:hypothetical protein
MTDDEKKRIITGPTRAGKSATASVAAVYTALRGKIITDLPWPDEASFWGDKPESE